MSTADLAAAFATVFVVAAATSYVCRGRRDQGAPHEEGSRVGTVEWVFRHAGNCLIEVPPLELPPPPDRATMTARVATLWPGRHVAQRVERGAVGES